MIRKTALIAFVSLLAVGMSVGAFGATPGATGDAPLAQEEETTTEAEAPEETTEEDEEAAEETTAAEEAEQAENATVTFGNQTSNGSAVVVNETDLPEGGFVVIHLADNVTADSYDDPENVSVGPVVGNSSFLEAGSSENVTVELNRSVDESQPLVAMPHQDTNDNQEYDFPEADDPYTQDQTPVIDVAYVTLDDNATDEEAAEMTETETEVGADMTETEEADDEDTETTTEE